MRVNRNYKPKLFRFKDNFNIDYSPYYIIDNGVYKFLDLRTKITFMYKYGITCGCERSYNGDRLVNGYNGIVITERQKDFLRKRAIALSQNHKVNTTTGVIPYDCGCKKKRQE